MVGRRLRPGLEAQSLYHPLLFLMTDDLFGAGKILWAVVENHVFPV